MEKVPYSKDIFYKNKDTNTVSKLCGCVYM